MATDAKKVENTINFMAGMIVSMGVTAYNILGDSAISFGTPIGSSTLKQWEKEMGLEIAGEDPVDVIQEIARIWVDEYGVSESIEVKASEEDHSLTVKVIHCHYRGATDAWTAATGMQDTFLCPMVNTFKSALNRMGYKFKVHREPLEDHGSVFIFEAV